MRTGGAGDSRGQVALSGGKGRKDMRPQVDLEDEEGR